VRVTLLKLPNNGVAPAMVMVASREAVDQFQSAACVAVITTLPDPIRVAVLPEIFAIFSLDDLKDHAPADVDVGGVSVYTGLFKLCEGIENTPTVGAFPATTTEISRLIDKKSAVAAWVATRVVAPTPFIESTEPMTLATAVFRETYDHAPVEVDVGGVIASAPTPQVVDMVDQLPLVMVGRTAADAGAVEDATSANKINAVVRRRKTLLFDFKVAMLRH
jgi:hypothetical protein